MEETKEEAKRELLANTDEPMEELNLIDVVERLGVAYHIEREADEALQRIHEAYNDQDCDLNRTSLVISHPQAMDSGKWTRDTCN